MTGAPGTRPVVVLHDRPEDFSDLLGSRFPDLEFRYASAACEVHAALHECDPRVVLSIKHTGFPDPGHRPCVEHHSVRWIHVGGSGFEHLEPWDTARLTVTNSAGVLSAFLAETVIGAMLALNGGFLDYFEDRRHRRWRPRPFRPLSEQTLLVVGLGQIGARVAELARAHGMRVLAVRRHAAPHPSVDEMFTPDRLHEALGRADHVSLHVRSNADTRHLIDRVAIAAMKPGAVLLNTARGAVVDEVALTDALASRLLGGAYLDVFETEPLPATSPLWELPNVLVTPHTSDNVVGWPRRFAELFADNLERWLAGEPLRNVVSP